MVTKTLTRSLCLSVDSQLRQDVIDGEVHLGHDLQAVRVALSAFLATEFSALRQTRLDQRVSRILHTWLTAMAEPPPSEQD